MGLYYDDGRVQLWHGQALDSARELADQSVSCIVTSPPYFGLRDYGADGQIGAEETVEDYVDALVTLFRELRRVLADDGTLWLNLGDSYAGSSTPAAPREGSARADGQVRGDGHSRRNRNGLGSVQGIAPKNLLMVPARVALALQTDGWILRSDIIWSKPNPMPESVTDRPTKSHEHVFLFSKSDRYFYDAEAISEKVSDRETTRPQRVRAEAIARAGGLTPEHFEAIRAVGISDTGKALTTTSGTGKNSERMKALADEAKAVLGGYYREFLMGETRNARDVWTIPTMPFSGAHFAVFPSEVPRRCIRAGAKRGGVVLDPFSGSGTTGEVALMEGCSYIGFDLNSDYLDLSLRTRFAQQPLDIQFGSGD